MTTDELRIAEDEGAAAAKFLEVGGIGVVGDPYPAFAEKRRTCPVQPVSVRDLLNIDPDTPLDESVFPNLREVYSHDAVQEVLGNPDLYSSECNNLLFGPVIGTVILGMDGAEHRRYRGLVQQVFSRKALDRWRTEIVTPTIDKLIDEFAEDGEANLLGQLTRRFPVGVMAGILGIPDDDLAQFSRWSYQVMSLVFDLETAMEGATRLKERFSVLLEARRAEPTDDLVSHLLAVRLDGEQLADEEIYGFLLLLLVAGVDTATRGASNLLFGLLTHPGQLDAVRVDRDLVPRAVEEALRWEAPTFTMQRNVTRDTELAGTALEAGSIVVCNMGSANHDETRWENPDAFDVFRRQQAHLAFGHGPHICLGMNLARLEIGTMLERLLDRLPDLRLDAGAEPPAMTGKWMREPTALPVVFTPARPAPRPARSNQPR